MRKIKLLFGGLLGLLLHNVAVAGYVDEVLADSPVAYWRFDETGFNDPIIDITGNVGEGEYIDLGGIEFGFDGAIVGDESNAVQIAYPANFSCGEGCGRGDVPVGGVLDLGNVDSDQPISLEAWFQILPSVNDGPLAGTAFPRLFHYNNFDLGQYSFGVVGDNNGGFEGQRTVWAARGDGSDAGAVILAAESDAIPSSDDPEWHHFVALLDGFDIRLFLNGEELFDLTDSDPVFWQAQQASIGARLQSDESTIVQAFPGLIDELAIYDSLLSEDRIMAHYLSGIGQGVEVNIDTLQDEIFAGTNSPTFDFNDDGLVNLQDELVYVNEILNSWIGDSNLDGEFSSSDFVAVFTAGQYEDNDPTDPSTILNSTWATGDWNADKEFNSSDFVTAFSEGGFELGPRGGVAAVPEPANGWLTIVSVLFCVGLLTRRQ